MGIEKPPSGNWTAIVVGISQPERTGNYNTHGRKKQYHAGAEDLVSA